MARPSRPSARINRIAFINTEGQLETIDPDGNDRRLLATDDRIYQFPAWSPDGRYIAALGGNEQSAGIYVFEDDAEVEGRQLFSSPREAPVYLYWSPDNKNISFIALRPSGEAFGLHLVSVEGSHTDRTLITGRPCFWNWNARGDEMILHTGFSGEEGARLVFGDPSDPDTFRLDENIAKPGLFQTPCFSSSGRYWSFAQINEDGFSQIVIDGHSVEEQLYINHYGAAAMAWNPSRDILAFISPEADSQSAYGPLRLVNPQHEWTDDGEAEGIVEVLTDDRVLCFFWSPNGESLAYITLANTYERLKDILQPKPQQFDLEGGTLREPAPDREREIHLNLFVMHMDEDEPRLLYTFQPHEFFTERFLPFFDQYAHSHRIWSPDSDAIVLPVLDQEEPKLMIISTRRGSRARPRVLVEGLMAFWSVQ